MGGIIYPGKSWKPGFQAGAKADILQFSNAISLFIKLNYWESKSTKEYLGLTLSNFYYGIDLKYKIQKSGFYVGGGMSNNNLQKEYQTGLPSEPNNLIGGSIFTGYDFPFDNYDSFFTELRYSKINDYNVFGLQFGLYFHMT